MILLCKYAAISMYIYNCHVVQWCYFFYKVPIHIYVTYIEVPKCIICVYYIRLLCVHRKEKRSAMRCR